jgi:hypothetical protein
VGTPGDCHIHCLLAFKIECQLGGGRGLNTESPFFSPDKKIEIEISKKIISGLSEFWDL